MTTEDRYHWMEEETTHAKEKWARILGVSRSGYYAWKASKEGRIEAGTAYEARVLRAYAEGEGHYGAERICGVIRSWGYPASFKVVQGIMRANDLVSSHCRRRQRSLTDSRKARGNEYENRVLNLDIDRPFQVLSSDITYVRTGEGFDYLCQIRDVLTGVVLASHQQERMTKDLVLITIRKVQARWRCPAGTLFHSDRGSQYTAKEVRALLASYGWLASYSRVGKPSDNAWSESFFANMKKEIVHWRHFPTREMARQVIFEYIEIYYNNRRVQKRLGYQSPLDFLKSWERQYQTCVA